MCLHATEVQASSLSIHRADVRSRINFLAIGQKILTALREFGDVVESGELLEAHFTVRTYVVPAEPAEYDGPAVRAVRERYVMSQGAFARVLCDQATFSGRMSTREGDGLRLVRTGNALVSYAG
jgi:hypothetical protein